MPRTLPEPPSQPIHHEPRGELSALLGQLQILIADTRQRALRAADVIQVQTCWQVGRQQSLPEVLCTRHNLQTIIAVDSKVNNPSQGIWSACSRQGRFK